MANTPVAVVTGAGSGIGRATALRLASEGYTLVLVGRTKAKLHETANLIEQTIQAPPRLSIQSADVTDPHQVDRLISGVVESFGQINALVNVAGYASLESLAEITPETWRKTIDANASSVVYLTQAAWPHLARSDDAIVVNVSSVASKDPFPGLGVYGAAKVAVNLLTRVTADEGQRQGINAVAIAPGAVETPMLRGLFDEKQLPSANTLDPSRVADLIADCITGQREFKPGETLFINP